MLANRFTKALQNNAFQDFVRQLGLVDIKERLDQKDLRELDIEEYLEKDE